LVILVSGKLSLEEGICATGSRFTKSPESAIGSGIGFDH